MVFLITKANGVAAMLFHVEHSEGLKWHYRWRITGTYPASYCQWRECAARESRASFHPEIIGCPLEVEWRPSPKVRWRQAALRETTVGGASFRVKAVEDFSSAGQSFTAVSPVTGGGVAHYGFGPLELAAGVETVVSGVAVGGFPDNVLLRGGEFRSRDPRLEVENTTASEGSFVATAGSPSVTLYPGLAARRLFAFTGHSFREEMLATDLAGL